MVFMCFALGRGETSRMCAIGCFRVDKYKKFRTSGIRTFKKISIWKLSNITLLGLKIGASFMPVIRVELSEGTPAFKKSIIRDKVKKAVLDTLAPKETKYDYVAIREVFGYVGDGLPLITVDLRPGREKDRKKALVDAIANVLEEELGILSEDVYVLFREHSADNHYTGGSPLPDWVPADR